MELTFKDHCTDDALELYAMGRLGEAGADELEEHLLLCEPCRDRLDETDIFIRAMRGAAARLRSEEEKETFSARVARSLRIPLLPRFPVWAAGAACACVLAVSAAWLRQPAASGPPFAVSLVAERGVAKTVPAHRPLEVLLDARGLDVGSSAHVVLVNADGAALEQADNPVTKGNVQARFSTPLSPGDYFVRIYLPGKPDPVREFALRAQ